MSMSDPIADFLTRIRNAHMAKKTSVDMPASNLKIRILYVLKEENNLVGFLVQQKLLLDEIIDRVDELIKF